MKLSVIIPTLNEEKNLIKLLPQIKSIFSEKDLEIIVVDGGSKDQTLLLSKKYAQTYQVKEGNRGRQLAVGAEKSRGEILWFLHADSVLAENHDLFTLIEEVVKEGNFSSAFFQLSFEKNTFFYNFLSKSSNWRARHLGLIFGDQGLLTTRKNYEKVGGFPSVPLMEDWLISRKLRKIGKFTSINIKIYSSIRKYEKNPWRTFFFMQRIKLAFVFGRSPEKLAKRYYHE